jgi:enediyne biosynthesis protein E4
MGSMGADACDLDNDLLPDLFVTEMLPRDHKRKKQKTSTKPGIGTAHQ